jgi:hypothetical protein
MSIYTPEKVFRTTERWERWWWKNVNKACERCTKSCKQSDKVTLCACPQFEKKEKDDALDDR